MINIVWLVCLEKLTNLFNLKDTLLKSVVSFYILGHICSKTVATKIKSPQPHMGCRLYNGDGGIRTRVQRS